MSNCGCEGSCPICLLGEVDDHKCNKCGAVFCPKCHGLLPIGRVASVHTALNVLPCSCKVRTWEE
jgi:hypothetical protein